MQSFVRRVPAQAAAAGRRLMSGGGSQEEYLGAWPRSGCPSPRFCLLWGWRPSPSLAVVELEHTRPFCAANIQLWKKAGFVGGFFVVLPTTAYMVYIETTHEHEHKEIWSHMQKRVKPFPWKAHNCDFFDRQCIKEAKSGQKAAHH